MRTPVTTPLTTSTVAARLGLCAAALAGTAATTTDANATVVSFNTPISVPNTFAGVYINFLTGASGITTGAVPGWDFGPWGSSGALSLFWNGSPANSNGGVAATTSGPYLDLGIGSVISSASTFSASAQSAQAAAFQTAGNHILGFRFFNENTSAINYGYLTITTGSSSGFPATITGWSFENSGGQITVVPEPTTTALMSLGALALGALNLRRLRREQRKQVH